MRAKPKTRGPHGIVQRFRGVESQVHTVTDAPRSLRADVRSREVRYLLSMGVRTACFLLAFVTSGVLRWSFVVAAFVLPYIAVVAANAGRERKQSDMPIFVDGQRKALPESSADSDVKTPHSKENFGPDGPFG